ncbi:MAG: superoxide dismutase [Kiritimatiellae bacterium]|nr:superoxide dismutase [Kiritimatiellia bacterium]MDD5522717.1 superoxide dismutase [Kiritimatiellia bacterium]
MDTTTNIIASRTTVFLFSSLLVISALHSHSIAADDTTSYKPAPLPYAENALEPVISAKTVNFHYEKHHKTYADKLSDLLKGTDLAGKKVEELIKLSAGQADKTALFNNAAQLWNHDFFWTSMKPNGGGVPTGKLANMIKESFGSFDECKKQFADTAVSQFGSGWAWLVLEGKSLKIIKTSNADTPIAHGQKPLLCIDVWEHAYYLDHQNRRKDFVSAFLDKLVNWDFASSQLGNK